ncbi:ferritin-like domain-containing protein [Streptomyces sp. F63]|uniref:ferritin-like domain-containing protein n=1 Tax=Streptomyces sp. F63 TaxID=2824887 RepID=UPI001B363580|nr:ferritin-like domain-containing protein [Streptomyces sp. F63]MBQ0984391.1 ferritin-like domain-containing protein [Streptomyces sp. F63]
MITARTAPRDDDAPPEAVLDAAQHALRAEHAAVYGYGVVGGRIGEDRRKEAREGHDAHRARRDTLHRTVRDLGGEPEASAAAYALPFPVPDAAAAARLAAELEERVAAVYADLVRAAEGGLRRDAAGALREAAVRAVRWRGGSVAFPGLTERSAPAEPTDGPPGGGASEL